MPGRQTLIKAKRGLLGWIAEVNGCKMVQLNEYRNGRVISDTCAVVGFEDEVIWVEQLYTSLLLQMTHAMESELVRVEPRNAAVFRNNFAWGFAQRIYQRLLEVRRRTEGAAVQANASTALVLRDRSLEVMDKFRTEFPRIRKASRGKARQLDRDARARGDAAGSRADLGQDKLGDRKKLSP